MRTEFSFLTGIANRELGFNRFDPYQAFVGRDIPSLTTHLGMLGYRCVCIHPHSASFFGRNRIFPGMGFDDFLDISVFDKNRKFGPYVGDLAVADKILQVLREDSAPLFVFAVTMENHGPLHLEHPDPKDEANLYRSPLPKEPTISPFTWVTSETPTI